MKITAGKPLRTPQEARANRVLRTLATSAVLATTASLGLPLVAASAAQVPVGAGFTVTPADLSYILKQIKIAEAHVANTTSETGPCGALLGNGPNQLASPLLSQGLRTVDGSCNNLQQGQESFGASDQVFPRLGTKSFPAAESGSFGGPPSPTSYEQKSGAVFDSRPRVISNLIADQTSTNPAAVAAAGFPARTQGNQGVVPCTTDPDSDANPPVAAAPRGLRALPKHTFHPQRDNRCWSFSAIQLTFHPLRTVLRPWH